MARYWTIAEHEGFYAEAVGRTAEKPGCQPLPRKYFAALKELLGAQPEEGAGGAAIFSLSHERGLGDVVKAGSHVGVVAFADGSQIEILPKLARKVRERSAAENERLRGVLLRMLRDAFDLEPALRGSADLRVARLPLLEAFFRMYLEALGRLVKRGLSGGYARVEGNERFFKGKLLMAEHLRRNLVRRERFWVAHDVFHSDTPANRLSRSGLDFVRVQAASEANRRAAGRLAGAFEEIPPSRDFGADFAACVATERDGLQREALRWCDVFLRGRGMANLPGARRARAFLFPMETVFERAVARALRRNAPEGVEVSVQEKRRHLFEESPWGRAFQLKPDIVIRRGGKVLAVADTKWKLLSDNESKNFDMSQTDMYQVYAYQKRYRAEQAVLIYPAHRELGKLVAKPPIFQTVGDADVRVVFWNSGSPVESSRMVFQLEKGAMEVSSKSDERVWSRNG